jgi:hypothetical protein
MSDLITAKGVGIFIYCLVMTALSAANFGQVKGFAALATYNTIIMIMALVTAVISLTYWIVSSFQTPVQISSLTSVAKGPDIIISGLNFLQNLFLFFLFGTSVALSLTSAVSKDFVVISSTGRSLIWAELSVSGIALLLLGGSAFLT